MKSENAVQTEVRLEVSQQGGRIWRNNTGVFIDKRGIPVRYGLCNESKRQNQFTKSSDLIGIKPVLITAEMVGELCGQFVAYEIKKEGWTRNHNDKRENAQENFINIVRSLGGEAKFISDVDDL